MMLHQPTSTDEIALPPVSNHLYWFNGLPTTDEDQFAIGLHLPCGNPVLDPLADLLGWSSYTVLHTDKLKPYWQIQQASLIFIASNMQQPSQLHAQERKGIAYGWGPVWDFRTGDWKLNRKGTLANICQVKVRILLHELASLGFCEPFELALRGRITDSFLQVCQATYRLTGALVSNRQLKGSRDPVYLYSVSIPIQAASQSVPVSSETSIYPIVAMLPSRLSAEFVYAHQTPAEVVQLIQAGLLPEAIRWSTEESARIRAGARPDGGRTVSSDSAVLSAHSTPLSQEQEERALDLLFADEITLIGKKVALGDQGKQRLTTVKEGFRTLLPLWSAGTPNWWKTVLLREFPDRWKDEAEVNETQLREADLSMLEQKYLHLLNALRPSQE